MKKILFLFLSTMLITGWIGTNTYETVVEAEEAPLEVPTETSSSDNLETEEYSSSTVETTTTEQQTSDSKTTETSTSEPIITEENNNSLGSQKKETTNEFYPFVEGARSDLAPKARSLRAAVASIGAADNTRPAKDFIDISSHNGSISVANYNTMKSYGVKGVIVKLTEYTTYQNPYAAQQIANAKAAGLKVGVYHYSWFTTTAEAQAEARYFAAMAKSLGLPADTLMVNDAEQVDMTAGNVTNNSVAFANQLNSLGYGNVMHYSMLNWFNTGVMNANTLGYDNIWVAQYPYEPLASNLLNTQYAAWQWASTLTFPGVSGNFDISIDYNDIFNGGIKYDDIYYNTATNFTAVFRSAVESARHTIYDDIYYTKAGVNELGLGSLYAGQTVTITRIAETVKATWFQFSVNGKVVGWINSKAFNMTKGNVYYSAYVGGNGWQYETYDGRSAGTTGEKKMLQALKLNVNNVNADATGDIEYRVHAQTTGWESTYKKNGAISGKENSGKRIEAVQIRLTGELAAKYDVYYRVHVSKLGWLGWAKNDQKAGSTQYSYAVEDIQVVLVEKNGTPPGSTEYPFREPVVVSFKSHVQSIGWQTSVTSNTGVFSGTTNQQKQIEAAQISLSNRTVTGSIEYQLYVQKLGWMPYVKENEVAGTEGQKRRAEAIRMKLTGELAQRYDIYYRVHSRSFGWLDWAKNGQEAGTAGYSYRMEAFEVRIVEKGQAAPGATSRIFVSK